LSGLGYGGLEVYDLIKDLIYEETTLDAPQVVALVLPKYAKQISSNVPVFKYLSQTGDEDLTPDLLKYVNEVRARGIDFWISNSMRKSMGRSQAGKPTPKDLDEVCQNNDMTTAKGVQQALQDLAFVPAAQIDLNLFRKLLVEVWERYDPIQNKSEQTLTTHFRRAVRIFDWLKYGHKKHLKCQREQKQTELLPTVSEPGVFLDAYPV
jgi:hypothetical protein